MPPRPPSTPSIVLLALLTTTAPITTNALTPTPNEEADCKTHPPIRIRHNQGPLGLILTRHPTTQDPIHRPGNGVTHGNGTQDNPYVIQGWCIPAPTHRPGHPTQGLPAIRIQDTTAHLVIQNTTIGHDPATNRSPWAAGIAITGSTNVTLRNNTITNTRHALNLDRTHATRVVSNTLRDNRNAGIHLRGTHGTQVVANTIEGTNGSPLDDWTIWPLPGIIDPCWFMDCDGAIQLENTHNTTITRNHLHHNRIGIESNTAQATTIHANHIAHNSVGTFLRGPNATITHNNVTANHWGMVLTGAWPQITNNTVTNNTRREGMALLGVRGAHVEHNHVAGNGLHGIEIRGRNLTVANNTVQDNAFAGIRVPGKAQSTPKRIVHNTVTGNGGWGITTDAMGTRILDNAVHDNGAGIELDDWRGVVHGNNIAHNGDPGLSVDVGSGPRPVQDNWWGHATGPSGGVTDKCTGTVADGHGQRIEGGRVCFDPWLRRPNPHAGAVR